MKTPGEFAYESWCRNAGVKPKGIIERARDNSIGTLFVDLMNEHTVQGYFRYGTVRTYRDHPISFVTKVMECLKLYDNDGNIEHFVDIANWARIAFHYDRHPRRHYDTATKERD